MGAEAKLKRLTEKEPPRRDIEGRGAVADAAVLASGAEVVAIGVVSGLVVPQPDAMAASSTAQGSAVRGSGLTEPGRRRWRGARDPA